MKKTTIAFLMLFPVAVTVNAQKETAIEPSGKIITKKITVKTFDGIKAEGLYELILTQGDNESVKIEADDNLMELFTVANEGSTLLISMPKLRGNNIHFNGKKDDKNLKLKVYVVFKQLKNLDVAVIGNVRSESVVKASAFNLESKNVGNVNLKLAADKLTVNNKGVGNVTLLGTATNAEIKNKGVGAFEGSDLIVQTMNIDNSGVGGANVNVAKDLSVKQSFLGKVSNKGNAKTHKMDAVEM